jgi:hypothetical protein
VTPAATAAAPRQLLLLLLLLQRHCCLMLLHLLLALTRLTVLHPGWHQQDLLCLPLLHRGNKETHKIPTWPA